MNHNLMNATANPTTAITGAGSSCSATFTPSANVPSAFVTVGSDTFSNAAGKLNQDGADANNAASLSMGMLCSTDAPTDSTTPHRDGVVW